MPETLVQRLFPSLWRNNAPQITPTNEEAFHFAMNQNAYFMSESGRWHFDQQVVAAQIQEFRGQRVSYFGPTPHSDKFFSSDHLDFGRFTRAFRQESVYEVIKKYREIDKDLASRIAFLLGGIVRYQSIGNIHPDKAAEVVKYTASITSLADKRSGDAVASAIARHVISTRNLTDDPHFNQKVYFMSDAISRDPISPQHTNDLGLSQVARLRAYVNRNSIESQTDLPDVTPYQIYLDKLPTVGAEFHLPSNLQTEDPEIMKKLALLNMSQYHRGSYIQMSRKDRGVIEVRMNPSTYPITIANWNHLRLLIPKLNEAYFTITLNRETDFSWERDEDERTINLLRSLGMLTYATSYQNVPNRGAPGELNFGDVYLGQTVKLQDQQYKFSGLWAGGEGSCGQIGIFAGFGKNFPHLTYFLSMALANQRILNSLRPLLVQTQTLEDAVALESSTRLSIFNIIKREISRDKTLNNARLAGNKIMELLNP